MSARHAARPSTPRRTFGAQGGPAPLSPRTVTGSLRAAERRARAAPSAAALAVALWSLAAGPARAEPSPAGPRKAHEARTADAGRAAKKDKNASAGHAHAGLAQPAQASASPASNGASSTTVEVRVAVEQDTQQRIPEGRLRALLESELQDQAVLAPGTSGPLGDHVAYIWVSTLAPDLVTIEVRVGGKAMVRRDVQRTSKISWDSVTRFVALTAAELLRVQLLPPPPPKKPPPPRQPTPEELERAARDHDHVELGTYVGGTYLFDPDLGALGPALELGLRRGRATLAGRLGVAGGGGALGSARAFEAGVGIAYRAWLGATTRTVFGAWGGLTHVSTPATTLSRELDRRDALFGRATAFVGLEQRLARGAWLGARVTPTLLLGTQEAPERGASVGGFGLGGELGLILEMPTKSSTYAPATNGSSKPSR